MFNIANNFGFRLHNDRQNNLWRCDMGYLDVYTSIFPWHVSSWKKRYDAISVKDSAPDNPHELRPKAFIFVRIARSATTSEIAVMNKFKTNTLLRCPICNKKLWLTNVISHRKLKHPDLTHNEFEAILIAAIKSGDIQPKVCEASTPGLESGTQKLLKCKTRSPYGVKSIVQGGGTSPKWERSEVSIYRRGNYNVNAVAENFLQLLTRYWTYYNEYIIRESAWQDIFTCIEIIQP